MSVKQNIIESYYNRDITLNINPKLNIIKHMNKLNYKFINKSNILSLYLNDCYISDIKWFIIDPSKTSYNEWLSTFQKTTKYDNLIKQIDYRIKRSIELSRFIGSDKIIDFYNNCTIEELTYLGY
jgi:hypothetical protein